jgi:hypothetical protein
MFSASGIGGVSTAFHDPETYLTVRRGFCLTLNLLHVVILHCFSPAQPSISLDLVTSVSRIPAGKSEVQESH